MSLIFENYKFNEKYHHNDPNNLIYFKKLDNNEKQRRKLLENSFNGNLKNAYFNYSPIVNKIKNNEYSNRNSPLVKNNNKNNRNFNNNYNNNENK